MEHDHIVYRMLDILGKLILCSILWVLCSIPFLTVGASTTALYYSVVKSLRRDGAPLTKSFFHAFRENFRQSTVVHIVLLWLSALPVCVLMATHLGQADWGVMEYAMVGILILLGLVEVLVYPVISRFYHKRMRLVRFLLLLLGRHPFAGIGSLLMLFCGCLLVLSNGAFLLFIPGVLTYAQSFLLEPVFRKYSAEDENYNLWYSQSPSEEESFR